MKKMKRMNMVVEQECPFNKSVLQLVLRLGLMALGTMGLIFLNFWVSVVYLIYSFKLSQLLFLSL